MEEEPIEELEKLKRLAQKDDGDDGEKMVAESPKESGGSYYGLRRLAY